jgi:hypothetical protein
MTVHHLVSRTRLNRRYFRRWLYWNGISRAILHRQGGFDIEEPDLENPPNAGARQFGGVPRPLLWKAARATCSLLWHTLKGNAREALRLETLALLLCRRRPPALVRPRPAGGHRTGGAVSGRARGPVDPTSPLNPFVSLLIRSGLPPLVLPNG